MNRPTKPSRMEAPNAAAAATKPPAAGRNEPEAGSARPYNEARFDVLIRNVRGGIFHNLGFATVVVFALWDSAVPTPVVLAWVVAMLAGIGQRYGVLLAIKREAGRRPAEFWLKINVASALYMGLVWGACSLAMFFGLSTVQSGVVMLAVAGITAGVAANGFHRPYLIAYLVPSLVPLAVFFLTEYGAVHKAMAAMVILYGYILFRTGRIAADKLRRSTDLVSENEALVRSLQETLEESRSTEERYQIIANYSYAWECWFDVDGRVVWTSPSVERITGYRPADFEADPRLIFSLIHPDDLERVTHAMDFAVNVPSEVDLEFRILHKDGEPRWVAAVSNPIYDREGRSSGFRSSVRDISVQKKLEAELQSLAATDSLTGTLNRRAFLEKANEEVYRAARYDKPLTVAMFDLDHFKRVNDTHGHNVGDRCIVMLADVVKKSIRQSDLFARFGGEEFVLLLPETELAPALQLCERLRQKVEDHAVATEGAPINITVSIGIADFQQNSGLEEIIARADAALYTAKRNGRNQVAYGSALPGAPARRCHPASIDRLRREMPEERELQRPVARR